MNTERAAFKVAEMHCMSCKRIVEKQPNDEKAVKKITFDYLTDGIDLEFDPLVLTTKEIKNCLDKSGYKFVRLAS